MATDRRSAVDAGLLSQVKPTFMAPAVGMSLFGGLLSPTLSPALAVLHAATVGTALYVAHLVDEYVDAHVRGEDRPCVPKRTNRRAIVAASVLCLCLVWTLGVSGRWVAAASGILLWVLAVLHAPVLDRNTVAVTVDYPVGIALALTGGYLTQRAVLPLGTLGTAGVFVAVLAAVKVSIDRLDVDFDRTVDKRTVPVVVGERRAAWASAGLFLGAAGLTVGLVALSALPDFAFLSVPVLVVGATAGLGESAEQAVERQIVAVYPFAAVLFLTQCLATDCVVETLVF